VLTTRASFAVEAVLEARARRRLFLKMAGRRDWPAKGTQGLRRDRLAGKDRQSKKNHFEDAILSG
jgi:hypothetical protein